MKQRPLITMFLVFIKFSGLNGADGSEILEEFWAWLACGGVCLEYQNLIFSFPISSV